jgi:hypothetical protein
MDVAFQAMAGVKPFDRMNAGVYFGMGCDAESARWALRWRMQELLAASGLSAPDAAIDTARDLAAPALDSTAVIGTMPNIPANRLSTQFDLRGRRSRCRPRSCPASRPPSRLPGAGRGGSMRALRSRSLQPVHRAAVAGSPPRRSAAGRWRWLSLAEGRRRAAGDRIYALYRRSSARRMPRKRCHAQVWYVHAAQARSTCWRVVKDVTGADHPAGMCPAFTARSRALRARFLFAGQAATVSVISGLVRFRTARPLLRL